MMTSDTGTQNQIMPCNMATSIYCPRHRSTHKANLEDVVDDEVTRDDDEEERHVDPAEQAELTAQARTVQGRDKADEACEPVGDVVNSQSQ